MKMINIEKESILIKSSIIDERKEFIVKLSVKGKEAALMAQINWMIDEVVSEVNQLWVRKLRSKISMLYEELREAKETRSRYNSMYPSAEEMELEMSVKEISRLLKKI